MANSLSADISSIKEIKLSQLSLKNTIGTENRKVAELVIKRRLNDENEGQHYVDLRIVLVGALGAGKSTLLGHICHGAKDNGRGKARLNLLKHRHELESGRSSSISHEIIGYDSEGELVNYATTNISTWEQICESSQKIVTFLDTCGFPKYLRTTMSGLMGYAPDYACLTIAGNSGTVSGMTKEHLSIAVMLEIPVFVVITKSDIASQSQLTNTLCSLLSVLNSPWINKVPVVVQNEGDLNNCTLGLSRKGPELPIFMVSSVTSSNIDLLLKFIHHLPQPIKMGFDELLEESVEFQIEDVYSLPDIGVVVGGVLVQGRVNVKDNRWYYLGPNPKGEFTQVKVKSIHRHRIPVNYVHCGQTAALALSEINTHDWKTHRGMVLLETTEPVSFLEFEAEIMVLYHETGVYTGTRGMIHSGSIQQHAQVISIEPKSIKPISDDIMENATSTLTDNNTIISSDPQYPYIAAEENKVLLKNSEGLTEQMWTMDKALFSDNEYSFEHDEIIDNFINGYNTGLLFLSVGTEVSTLLRRNKDMKFVLSKLEKSLGKDYSIEYIYISITDEYCYDIKRNKQYSNSEMLKVGIDSLMYKAKNMTEVWSAIKTGPKEPFILRIKSSYKLGAHFTIIDMKHPRFSHITPAIENSPNIYYSFAKLRKSRFTLYPFQ
ncbi:hypothetical protein G6F56_001538 [Rhizopus delemar]|nr:hypothetical protein G6F56_001538 [Rhizopus delemar]